jgi:hypothetical protein
VQVEDWRYENLKDDVEQLRKGMRDLEGRTQKVETWQILLPMRAMMLVLWLLAGGMVALAIVRAATGSQ